MMYHAYVQQSYETLDLLITDTVNPDYADYYKNCDQWYMSKSFSTLKEAVEHLWFIFNDHNEVQHIKINLEDTYILTEDTIKVMFAEKFLEFSK